MRVLRGVAGRFDAVSVSEGFRVRAQERVELRARPKEEGSLALLAARRGVDRVGVLRGIKSTVGRKHFGERVVERLTRDRGIRGVAGRLVTFDVRGRQERL